MSNTRTGNFPIGFRRGWTDWQKKDLNALIQWAKSNGFAALDLMNLTPQDVKSVQSTGLRLGSLDLLDFGALMSTDTAKRKDTIERNVAFVKQLAAAGVKVFFTCVIPGDATKKRSDNYAQAVECYAPIGEACRAAGAAMVIEGWPGGPPHYANLCCTPETLRAFLKDVPGSAVNFDPSHLIRLRVDPIRFLKEFAPQVRHVHGKDTDVDADALYEFGSQGSAFKKDHGFGEATWRYTIPGHGRTRWNECFRILKDACYQGVVSIELEDENFNGSEAGEKAGLLNSLAFLKSA
jgi:sugar phosphate isomerase/epimerase